MNMIAGNFVDIYFDPVSREDFEGRAKLIEQYREDCGDGLSMWKVEFLDEPGTVYLRTIFKEVSS